MPASRALPEPGEPLTTVLEARAARRRGAGEARRSEAKRAAEDGRIGDIARSREKHSMERRTALADVRNATRKRTAKREGLLRQTGTAIP